MKKLFLFVVWLGTAEGDLLVAQTDPLPSFDEVEAFLNQSETNRHQRIMSQVDAQDKYFASLVSSPVKLLDAYKDAYAAVHFEGAQKEHAKVKEWEDKNKALFKEDGFQMALRLHVEYLRATLAKKAKEDKIAAERTMQWIESFPRVADKYEKAATQELLKGGVGNSVFLRAANQMGLLQEIENWHLGDLTNLPEIHRVNVISFFRGKKDPSIFQQWNYNLKLEQENAEREGLAAKKEYFQTHRRPWLACQMGKDYALYGQYDRGVAVMHSALKASPGCESYKQIVAEIRKVIAESKKAKPSVAP